ncbi:ABC transporter permease, partial [Streptomyces sp. SID8455]|nr:ABC transporter permease [Streptomyces sp. SID8455]
MGGAVLVLFALTAILYGIFYVAPGDVAQIACGPRCSPAQVAQVTEQLRLNDPLYVQYGHFLQGIVAGRDFSTGTGVEHCSAPCLGVSYQSDQQVTQLILAKLPVTGSLVIGAFAGWLLLGVGTGVLSAWRRGRLTERVLTWLTLAGAATPVFVIGLLLIIVFCSTLQWLPAPS